MFRKKNLLKIIFLLVVLTLTFSACAKPADVPTVVDKPEAEVPTDVNKTEAEVPVAEVPAEPQPPTDMPKPSGKLVIWVQQANQDVWASTVLPAFQAEYPDIEIEFVNYSPPEVANQVGLAIQGGIGVPDLAVTEYRSLSALVDLGGLMDLTSFLEQYKSDLNTTMMGYCSKDGKVYCAPWDIGPVVTFYRRDIFEAAGLSSDPESVSAAIATYDDYLETCKTIKEKTGLNCFGLNKANNYGTILENMLWQQGLGFYDAEGKVTIDAPYVVEAVEKIGEFWKADVVSDSLEWTDPWYAELNAGMDNKETPPIATITIGAWMGNFLKTWAAADQAGNWGVALMPAFKAGGIRASNQGGSAYFIPEGSQNPEAAKAFIEYVNLNSANQVAQFVYSDYFPANKATYSDPFFQEADAYFGGQVTRTLFATSANNIPFGYIYGPYAVTMSNNAAIALQNYALGIKTAQDALKEAADAVRIETGLP
ncbi:MAG: sugar ABC transporter substrate-binding protein [Anaerolineaceae bacterium]|nr:sugar ABC transporter substrate-binding protein [Anaerolineaceae bacterium]